MEDVPPLVPARIRTARVLETRPRGPGLREIRFGLRDGPLDYAAGQWLAFQVARGGGPEQGTWRVYSLCSAPHEAQAGAPAFSILAAVDTGGPGGGRMAALAPGEEIAFHGPYGDFTLRRRPPAAAVLAADGVGIGPVRGLVAALTAPGAPAFPITLVQHAVVPLALAFRDEFEDQARRHAGITYTPTVPGADSNWHGETRDLPDLLPALFPDAAAGDGLHWYLCGSGRAIDPVAAWLRSRGVDGASLRVERFFD